MQSNNKEIEYCFIILHYMALNETIQCIQSIKTLTKQNNLKIVVVDNASPNGSGKKLEKIYKNDSQIDIVFNVENWGFSKANNIGCDYAKKKWNPRFYIVTNNDVIFSQKDFCEKIENEYKNSYFDVLGMDIFCVKKGIHQSPIAKEPPNVHLVNKTIVMNWLAMKGLNLCYPILKEYFRRGEQHGVDKEGYSKYQENVCVMGACIIFSSKFVQDMKYIFWPETKFYYEEFILSERCRKYGKKIIYQPEIKVQHMEGIATEQIDSEHKRKILFRMKNIYESAQIYKKELKK